ncbi:MAG: hypothetical protein P4M01_07285 [Acidobacteriota bacterium]|nr:hypothetical protein [Acidobacteriota bacterium]
MSATDRQLHLELAEQVDNVRKRIQLEPAYRMVFYKLLDYCLVPRTVEEAMRELQSYPAMATALHSPSIVLQWMVQAGGIDCTEAQEKQPQCYCTSEAGKVICEEEKNNDGISRIMAAEPDLQPLYLQVLQACCEPRSREALESMLEAGGVQLPAGISPSYFMDRLESVDAIQWQGGWRLTERGRASLHLSIPVGSSHK